MPIGETELGWTKGVNAPVYLKGLLKAIVENRDIQLVGSAPSFSGELDVQQDDILAFVNGAALGLKNPLVPDITFINTSISGTGGAGSETFNRLSNIKTDHLVILEGAPEFSQNWIKILERVSCNSFDFSSLEVRLGLIERYLGQLKGFQGDAVPSSGVFALIALLSQGAKSVKLNGFSLVDGHSYLPQRFTRRHVDMDLKVLEFVKKTNLPVSGTVATSLGAIIL